MTGGFTAAWASTSILTEVNHSRSSRSRVSDLLAASGGNEAWTAQEQRLRVRTVVLNVVTVVILSG